jgi:hypothetical protein
MSYEHLTEHERYLIDHMEKAELSRREIGRRRDRGPGPRLGSERLDPRLAFVGLRF